MDSVSPIILERANIAKLLWKFSVPAVVTTLATSLYNVIDRIFIGQGVGSMAISGLALTFPIMTLFLAFGTLVGVGASTRISIVLGMKDRAWAERILGNALWMTGIFWVITTILALCFLEPILYAFGGSAQTIPYAKSYLYIIIPGTVLNNLSFSFCNIIRAAGAPRKSMEIMLIGMFSNVFLDALFIFGFDWGIEGAAYATVISMAVTAYLTMRHFTTKKSFLRFHRSAFHLDRRIVWNIVSIGMSPFLMNAAACVVNVILNNRLYQNGGDLAIGAYGIINSYAVLFVMLTIGLCQGMQPIIGYNYGAGRMDRVWKTLKKVMIVACIVTSIGFLCAQLIPKWMTAAFTRDPLLLEITEPGLRFIFLLFPLIGPQIVISNFFQSLGKVQVSIFISLTRQVLFLIPALYICSSAWGLTGVWAASPIADTLSVCTAFAILSLFYKRSRKQMAKNLVS